MNFNQEQLKKLEDILREDFGIKITHKELFKIAASLVDYFELIIKIKNHNKKQSKG